METYCAQNYASIIHQCLAYSMYTCTVQHVCISCTHIHVHVHVYVHVVHLLEGSCITAKHHQPVLSAWYFYGLNQPQRHLCHQTWRQRTNYSLCHIITMPFALLIIGGGGTLFIPPSPGVRDLKSTGCIHVPVHVYVPQTTRLSFQGIYR